MKYIELTKEDTHHVDLVLQSRYKGPLNEEELADYIKYNAKLYNVSVEEIEYHIEDIFHHRIIHPPRGIHYLRNRYLKRPKC